MSERRRVFSVNTAPKLVCRLKNHVLTDEGDFVPAGTPVQVAGWAGDGERVEVRSQAYMYADSFDYEAVECGESHGCVNRGLWLSTTQDNLVFDSCASVALTELT